MQENELRAAIIGYGLAGRVFHGPLIASTPGMRVAAIVTGNEVRRRQAHAHFPQALLLSTADDLFSHPAEWDLVVVATPNDVHAALAERAMERGLPVVIDKPMALSVAEAERLLAVSTRTGVPFTPFQNRRWDGDFQTVQRILHDDLLGPIARFESRFERFRPAVRPGARREHMTWETGGGLLWDLGSHLIDQALLLFGDVERVYAELPRRREGAQSDDDAFVALHFASGVDAHLWMNVVSRLLAPRFRLLGLRGAYEKYGLDPQEDALRTGERPGDVGWGLEPSSAWGRVLTDVAGLTVDGKVETLPGAYERFYAGVRDALVHGSPMPVDPAGAVRAIRVIEAAHRSAAGGQIVTL